MSQDTKWCSGCNKEKPMSEFYFNSVLGRVYSKCKQCHVMRTRRAKLRRRSEYLAQQREYQRAHFNVDKAMAYNRKAAGTPKVRARKKLDWGVRSGQVAKPVKCEACGRPTLRRLLHGHHKDYTKPLEVEWLCSNCHGLRESGDLPVKIRKVV